MIEVANLSKEYGQRRAVQDLTFQVSPGEVYALLGPNGAGKTTTLRILSTLIRPTKGRAKVAGFDVAREPLEVRRRLGLVNGGMRVYDRLTGREVLRFFAGFYGLEGQAFQEALDWVADLLEMEETLERRVLEMSTGMRQKVVIARAILHRPPVLLLDEATAGLDVFARRALLDFVKAYRQLGNAIIYSTHVMSEAEEVADRVGFLHQGRLVYEGSKEEALALGEGSLEEAFVRRVKEAA
ncbi:ATP-binding cassette domain-containing protein [Thermus scotoductus]|uniref:ABC transporter ATP-binding protein n=1 Tax=Thermus scotoductus TaxID=37636 RepID=A0A430VKU9_THESC|nr:ATP-binding cassette domain-containing protein [Thermus scotoductus]RTG93199.1 ABC transporter ATP-binding protein [Thermus scotoductus]RTH01116.1 ABC transporter ATP-binding protein [Thermus scotoductus]RTH19369.1 ABC transporter ATP-binding protein [Thermus scotoductus]RTH96767.1 ABC transporter ATP-binding protein [Thermus scotoductus]RTI18021.1 ABC transporter ATP-binding protein [Thermus scotoductus]